MFKLFKMYFCIIIKYYGIQTYRRTIDDTAGGAGFCNNECLPGVIERDEQQKFPYDQVMKLSELGFMGMMIKP